MDQFIRVSLSSLGGRRQAPPGVRHGSVPVDTRLVQRRLSQVGIRSNSEPLRADRSGSVSTPIRLLHPALVKEVMSKYQAVLSTKCKCGT